MQTHIIYNVPLVNNSSINKTSGSIIVGMSKEFFVSQLPATIWQCQGVESSTIQYSVCSIIPLSFDIFKLASESGISWAPQGQSVMWLGVFYFYGDILALNDL